jgi:hypothetical protein
MAAYARGAKPSITNAKAKTTREKDSKKRRKDGILAETGKKV